MKLDYFIFYIYFFNKFLSFLTKKMEIEESQNPTKKKDKKNNKEQKREESKAKKSKRAKEYKTKLDDGFQKPKTTSELLVERRADRLNRRNQIRRQKINRSLKDRVVYQRCRIKACSLNNDINALLEEHLKLVDILKETDENKKTLAKTLVQIGSIYLENNESDKGLEYLKQAKRIFNENGDKKCENEINIRIENELNKLNGEQEESKEVKENKNE